MVPRPPVMATPPTTTAAITCISRPIPALLGIWLKRTAFSKAAQPVSAPVSDEDPEDHARRLDAGEARRVRVRAGGVHRASRGQIAQRPAPPRRKQRRATATVISLAAGLRQAEPLEARRQVLHPRALRDPAQAVAQRHHRRQRHDDGGNPHAAPPARR